MTAVVTETSVTSADGSRYYEYPPTGEQLDSVTTIISGTNAKPWLKTWAANVSSAWAVDNLDYLARVLKSDGRDAAVRLARDEAERLRTLKSGAGAAA
jgi:hypothetical protein